MLYIMEQELPAFAGCVSYFAKENEKFKPIFDSLEAHEEKLPGDWDTKLNSFEKIIFLKVIRPDAVSKAM